MSEYPLIDFVRVYAIARGGGRSAPLGSNRVRKSENPTLGTSVDLLHSA